VPAALDAVVLRALERDRGARYGSAREFIEALRPFGADGVAVVVDDGPAPARWPARPSPGRGVVAGRRRALAVGVAALALVLAALAAGYARLAL
jgi:hypothetical protein